MKQLNFITTNASKVTLANERLSKYDIIVKQLVLPIYEIQSVDIDAVSRSKAEQALKLTNDPYIIEDSSLEIKSLNGFPGTLLKPVVEVVGIDKIPSFIADNEDRSARVVGQLIYGDTKNEKFFTFRGTYEGRISKKPLGANTRGWVVSKIFIPENFDKTLAQMNDKEWQDFLDDFRKNDHYEKFGKWFKDHI